MAELAVLKTLSYDICASTSLGFLRFAMACDKDCAHKRQAAVLACRACRLTLSSSKTAEYAASVVGFACWSFARSAVGLAAWSHHLSHQTRTPEPALEPCVRFVSALYHRAQRTTPTTPTSTTPTVTSAPYDTIN